MGCLGDVRITDLDFADDALILAETIKTQTEALETLSEESQRLGLHVSWIKTKIQAFGDILKRDKTDDSNETNEYMPSTKSRYFFHRANYSIIRLNVPGNLLSLSAIATEFSECIWMSTSAKVPPSVSPVTPP